MTDTCKNCGKRLPLSRRRFGLCAPYKQTGKNCSEEYAKAHGLPMPLPRLFDTPEPPRPKRVINPRMNAINRRHGKDRRNE